MEILLVLAAVVMFVVTVISLSQVGRPYVPLAHREVRAVAPWQPSWLAVTPQEMWIQNLERRIYYDQMTAIEAISAFEAYRERKNE